MSKKHFIKLALAIAGITDTNTRKNVANLIADVCAESNPAFNRARFLEACNVEN